MVAGASMYRFIVLEKLAMLAPSMMRWSALKVTLMILCASLED